MDVVLTPKKLTCPQPLEFSGDMLRSFPGCSWGGQTSRVVAQISVDLVKLADEFLLLQKMHLRKSKVVARKSMAEY